MTRKGGIFIEYVWRDHNAMNDSVEKEIVFKTQEEAHSHTEFFENILCLVAKQCDMTTEEAYGSQYCTISERDENGNETIVESTFEKIDKFNRKHKLWKYED